MTKTDKNRLLMFSYGMNTDPEAMRQRTGNPRALGRARLEGWRFRFAVHADIVETPGCRVDGVLWDISQDHLLALDRREGYPVYYNRKTVMVEHRGKQLEAIVYYMNKGEPLASPSEGYLAMLHSGYSAFAVPKAQIYEAIKEAKKADSKPYWLAKQERDNRATARWFSEYDAVEDVIDDIGSKFYGRDVHSLTDAEWLDYELEYEQNQFLKSCSDWRKYVSV